MAYVDDSEFFDAAGEEDESPAPPQRTELPVAQLSRKHWRRTEMQFALPASPQALRVINGQLWCCHGVGITVLDSDLRPVDSLPMADAVPVYDGTMARHCIIPAEEMDCCRDVARLDNGDVVVAADAGLFHLTSAGGKKTRHQIESKQFVAVQVYKSLVYAAKRPTSSIGVYEYTDSWQRRAKLKVPCHEGTWLSISVKGDTIKVCCANDDKVHVLSLDGRLLKSVGATTVSGTSKVGTLDWPQLTEEGDDGSLLIADRYNSRLQILDARQEWSVVSLEPAVTEPRSAVRLADKLFVVTSTESDERVYCYARDAATLL